MAAAIVAAALSTGQASAAGEWTVSTAPAPASAQGNEWQVAPAGGSWTVASPQATAPPTPGQILDEFVGTSTSDVSAPPLPPSAVAAAVDASTVAIDENAPAVVALVAAEAELERINADLADVRSQLDLASDDAEIASLTKQETALEAQKNAAATRVDELRPAVDKLRKQAAEKAAQAQAASPFASLPGLSFAPVSSTVPTIDANLAGNLDNYLAAKGSPLAGHGAAFVYQATSVGLDPRLLVAISGAETSFGTYGPSQGIHNPFGMGPGIVYPSWDDAIAGAARNLGGQLYKGSGLVTIAQIQRSLGAAWREPTIRSQLNSNWYRNGQPLLRASSAATRTARVPEHRRLADRDRGRPGRRPRHPGHDRGAGRLRTGGRRRRWWAGSRPGGPGARAAYLGHAVPVGRREPRRPGSTAPASCSTCTSEQGVTLPRVAEQQARSALRSRPSSSHPATPCSSPIAAATSTTRGCTSARATSCTRRTPATS